MAVGAIIILEGNISAGKTTLAEHLSHVLGYRLMAEPVSDNPYLEDFYRDPKTFALPMQKWLLEQRHGVYLEALEHVRTKGQGVILDRSVWSDVVFARNSHVDGDISDEGFREYSALRERLLRSLPPPTYCIYLHASPVVCLNRIRNLRGRACESSIPIEYLAGLDREYRAWLSEMESVGSTVLFLNRNTFDERGVGELISYLQTPAVKRQYERLEVSQHMMALTS